MIFREHRGGLAESMATCVELRDTAELETYILNLLYPFYVDSVDLQIEEYTPGGDPRIGWDKLYIVTDPKFGVIGWLNSVQFPEEKK